MTRPIRPFVIEWISSAIGIAGGPDAGELAALESYESGWDALLAMPPADPGAEALLKTLSGRLNCWQAAGDPILFSAVHAERVAVKAEADRLLGAGQTLIFINEVPA